MPSYNVYSGDSSVLAAKINSTQTSGITIAAMNINGTETPWANTAGVIEVSEQADSTLKREWIYYTGTSVSSNVATLTGVVRGLSSTTSDVTSGGTGVAFSKGATVRFVTFHDLLNKKANLDRANSWSAVQTFATGSSITPTNTTTPVYHGQRLTTAERDALTGVVDGDWIYNTTLGQTQWREGGTWVTNAAGGTVADASTTVAGKVEEATISEISAGTAAGGTGARLFVNPSLVKKTSSGAAEGNVVALNATPAVDVSIGGTGVVSPTSGNLLVGAGASPMTLLAPGTSGNVVKSNGTTWTSATVPATSTVVYLSGASSASIGTSTASQVDFGTHTYTIPANDLTATTGYEIEGAVTTTWAAGNNSIALKLGSSYVTTVLVQPVASGFWHFKALVIGTAAAGASVAVRASMVGNYDANTLSDCAYSTTNLATNGTLAIAIANQFGASNAGNAAVLEMLKITKISTTAF